MSGRPKPRSDVRHRRNARSPKGREPHGDGAFVVVRVRENRTQGEGGQVDRSKEQGRRDAQSRPPEIRPLESRVPGNSSARFGGGQMEKDAAGYQSLLSHDRLTNPGTRRTSPAAYPTRGRSRLSITGRRGLTSVALRVAGTSRRRPRDLNAVAPLPGNEYTDRRAFRWSYFDIWICARSPEVLTWTHVSPL